MWVNKLKCLFHLHSIRGVAWLRQSISGNDVTLDVRVAYIRIRSSSPCH